MYVVKCNSCGDFKEFGDDNMHPWCMSCCDDNFDWSTQEDVNEAVERLRELDRIRDDAFEEWFLKKARECTT